MAGSARPRPPAPLPGRGPALEERKRSQEKTPPSALAVWQKHRCKGAVWVAQGEIQSRAWKRVKRPRGPFGPQGRCVCRESRSRWTSLATARKRAALRYGSGRKMSRAFQAGGPVDAAQYPIPLPGRGPALEERTRAQEKMPGANGQAVVPAYGSGLGFPRGDSAPGVEASSSAPAGRLARRGAVFAGDKSIAMDCPCRRSEEGCAPSMEADTR